ncbi:L-carnitine dehydrogenase [Pseudoruegeria aquimaris]|uniref:L-carnitine dehydrogenase n=1 Tax=Pseudoruegeria aquimaris TaxID=393663 RepID=A0A1Y5T6X1_9RHOB|nr:3-hydroxyacyl-CoA dehydrogenase NAD-binding domain-containing protein [Pseudoruegeria aquimaris]SLN56773.1 L-carnitine dehydrogenase [Pseudoruegeria aquimaris]
MRHETQHTASVLGCGAAGRLWARRFLESGWNVILFDPDPDRSAALRAELSGLGGRLTTAPTISGAVAQASWIQDCVPDRLPLKRALYQRVQGHCRPDALVCSCSRCFKLEQIRRCAMRPRQILRVTLCEETMTPVVDESPSADPDLRARAEALLRRAEPLPAHA